jgi:ubiquinone/menaquinone biosynthesis C-methylase UbiE
LNNQVLENHKTYQQRLEFYRGHGYDLEQERDLIINVSLPVSGNILEIGTGKGHFALALARRGFRFTSIDISSQEQAIAKLNLRYFKLEKKVDFRIQDAQALDLPDKGFDIIFSINVLHHLENPIKVLKEMVRLLSLSGKIVISDFTKKGLEIINTCHRLEGKSHDYFRHGLKQTKDYLIKEGFYVVERKSHAQRVLIANHNEG